MATLHAIGGSVDIDMQDWTRVNHAAQGAPVSSSQYTWTTTSGNTITVFSFQDDITFTAAAPTTGIVQAINAFGAFTVGGVLGNLVSMTAAPNLENFWLPILTGQTTIFTSANASFNGAGDFLNIGPGEVLTGGQDLFEGSVPVAPADRQNFFGDGFSIANTGFLNGGNDTIHMRANGRVSGDADGVLGTLNGADDTIVLDGPLLSGSVSTVSGDAIFNSDGESGFVPNIAGGNDLIKVLDWFVPLVGGGGGPFGGIAGDIFTNNAGQTKGGHDTIDGSGNGNFFEAYGDAQQVNGGSVLCGNDRLLGGQTFLAELSGDVDFVSNGSVLAGADTLIGGVDSDSLFGDFITQQGGTIGINALYTGDDSIAGGGGLDVMRGQVGDDILDGGMGDDDMNGGSNTAGTGDIAAFNTLNVAVSADLNLGFAFGQGSDTLAEFESLRGSNLNDSLGGSSGQNQLEGLDGNDTLLSRGGADKVFGGNGNDLLRGFSGNDLLVGQAGADNLSGGLNIDVFDYNAITESGTTAATRDTIVAFSQGGANADIFDLFSIDAQASVAGNQNFSFLGGAGFSAEGQVRFFTDGIVTVVEVNTSGLSVAEMTIGITGGFAMLASDFNL